MKEIFDFKRFGKYFVYDLRQAVNRYGLTALILGLWPFIWFVFTRFLSFVFGTGYNPDFVKASTSWPVIVSIIVVLSFGSRVYGGVTDRKKGADWISLPASALEKTLSLLLITCVVLPITLFVLVGISFALVSSLVPELYECLQAIWSDSFFSELFSGTSYVNVPLILWLSWCENILVFSLGALCFKRNKVGKTILCLIGLFALLGIITMLVFGTANISSETIERFLGDFDAARAQTLVNVALNLIYSVVFVLLIGGIYARIKTIKA